MSLLLAAEEEHRSAAEYYEEELPPAISPTRIAKLAQRMTDGEDWHEFWDGWDLDAVSEHLVDSDFMWNTWREPECGDCFQALRAVDETDDFNSKVSTSSIEGGSHRNHLFTQQQIDTLLNH